MRSHLPAFLAIMLATLVVPAIARRPQPSASCDWKCPPFDLRSTAHHFSHRNGGDLFCYYGWGPPGGPSCKYEKFGGVLIDDKNDNKCPHHAGFDCNSIREEREKRKEIALPRSPRAPSPGPRSDPPQAMKMRAKLGERKRRSRA